MSTRRKILAAGVVAGAAAVIAPEIAAAEGASGLRTGYMAPIRSIRGWSTDTPFGVFPANGATTVFPFHHFENHRPKMEIHTLLEGTEVLPQLHRVGARQATMTELRRVHTKGHIERMLALSALSAGGYADEAQVTRMMHNGHILAGLTAGGAVELARAVWKRQVKNGYALTRPPGHHAEPDAAMGFCVYNNLAIAAADLLAGGTKRILVFDWDVHTGNGTQKAFWDDPRVVIVDMHQKFSFPPTGGHIEERGAHNNILNVDLPPGTGHDTAMYVMEKVVLPAIRKHNPEIILVASGFDSGNTDPLGRFMFGTDTYGEMTRMLMAAANNSTCKGRIAMFHEGGYEEIGGSGYGLRVLLELSGIKLNWTSPFDQVEGWQRPGNDEEVLALHRKKVDRVAALVSQIKKV